MDDEALDLFGKICTTRKYKADSTPEILEIVDEMSRISKLRYSSQKETSIDKFLLVKVREILDNKSFFNKGFTKTGRAAIKELTEVVAIMRPHE